MEKVKFNRVLNKENKYYNLSASSIVGAGICGIFAMGVKGLIWGFCAGAVGFIIGRHLGIAWWKGDIQRYMYWQLPLNILGLKKSVPTSDKQNMM